MVSTGFSTIISTVFSISTGLSTSMYFFHFDRYFNLYYSFHLDYLRYFHWPINIDNLFYFHYFFNLHWSVNLYDLFNYFLNVGWYLHFFYDFDYLKLRAEELTVLLNSCTVALLFNLDYSIHWNFNLHNSFDLYYFIYLHLDKFI